MTMSEMEAPCVPVSWGELIDKLTILEIKRARIACAAARANVEREHRALSAVARGARRRAGMEALVARLAAINAALWDIEDAIRAEEAAGRFGAEFVRLARSVYRRNDERAVVKRHINDLLGSALVEEKSYASFAAAAAAPAPISVAAC